MNVYYLLKHQAEQYPSKAAIVFGNSRITYPDLRDQVIKLANGLKRLGVGKSDKVAVYLPNCPVYAYSYLAGFVLGAVVVPLDFMLKTDELSACLSHSETKILIASPKVEIDFKEIKKQVPSLKMILFYQPVPSAGDCNLGAGYFDYQRVTADMLSDIEETVVENTDPALIMYTSGTTGQPKGILLNYKHLDGSPTALKHFVDLTDRDVKISALPLSHIAGFMYIQNCLIFGITLVLMERFNPYEFLKNIQEYRVTCFHIVPAMYIALLSLKQIDKFDLSSLRWVVVFGAPSSPEIMEKFVRYCPGAQLLNGWGMTETCPPNTVTPLGSPNIASVGKPAPYCKIRIVDENDCEVPTGESGEITISGWNILDCYYKDPETTARLKKNGALYTGDIGRFDEEGYLYIVGRKKEMIKVGGQIVYAPEVEAAFLKHEGVSDVAVIGVPDKLRGEAVKAYVVLKKECNFSPEDLRYYAREHLAHFKVPQLIEIRADLPKNRTGKIDKELLKSEARAEQSA